MVTIVLTYDHAFLHRTDFMGIWNKSVERKNVVSYLSKIFPPSERSFKCIKKKFKYVCFLSQGPKVYMNIILHTLLMHIYFNLLNNSSPSRGYQELCQVHFCSRMSVDISDMTVSNLILRNHLCLKNEMLPTCS